MSAYNEPMVRWTGRHTGIAALALLCAASAPACREATAIRLVLRTNVPEDDSVSVTITVGTAEDIERGTPVAVVRGRVWDAAQTVGSLVITPPSSGNGPLTVRAVLSVGRDPETCSITDAASCVIARRRLAFVEHSTLTVPVVLYLQCMNVPCDPSRTCDAMGACVSELVPDGACQSSVGCGLPGDPSVDIEIPSSPSTRLDAGRDAVSDSRSDASTDGGSGGDAGGVNLTSHLYCPGATDACFDSTRQCCFDATGVGQCRVLGNSCVGYTYRSECHFAGDCLGGVCCKLGNSFVCGMTGRQCIAMVGSAVCTPTTYAQDCAGTGLGMCEYTGQWGTCTAATQ